MCGLIGWLDGWMNGLTDELLEVERRGVMDKEKDGWVIE